MPYHQNQIRRNAVILHLKDDVRLEASPLTFLRRSEVCYCMALFIKERKKYLKPTKKFFNRNTFYAQKRCSFDH